MKWFYNSIFLMLLINYAKADLKAQMVVEYLLVESDGAYGCGRGSDCSVDRFCLDLFMKVDTMVDISGYNLFFQYDNNVMRRGATNPLLDGSDNACFIDDAGDTDFDTSAVVSAYRVGGLYGVGQGIAGRTVPAVDSFFLLHNFCWEIIDIPAFYSGNQMVVVGEDVWPLDNIIGGTTGTPGVDLVLFTAQEISDTFYINEQTTSCLSNACAADTAGRCPSYSASGGVLYVDVNASGANDGSSWSDALTDLQDALDCPCADTVKVATGTYRPTQSLDALSLDPRDASFHVDRDIVLIGGYDASTGQIAPGAYTTLSADIGMIGDPTDNAYHVLVIVDGDLAMGGFYLEQGYANGAEYANYSNAEISRSAGGGIYALDGQVSLDDVVILSNYASDQGGAIWLADVTLLSIQDAIIESNRSGEMGAAIYASADQTPLDVVLTRVELIANQSMGIDDAWFDTSDLGQSTVSLDNCSISD